MKSTVDCPDITIANGATNSNAVRRDQIHEDADEIILMASVIDAARTYKIQVNDKADGTGTWYDLQDGTPANVIPPSVVNTATIYPLMGYTFRIVASAAVTGAVTWKMKKAMAFT